MTEPQTITTAAELVRARLDRAFPAHLYVGEIMQMTGLNEPEVVAALSDLEGAGKVAPVGWRTVRDREPVR